MYVLVTGASGGTGRRVVRVLLARGQRVLALTRDRARLADSLADAGVDLVSNERSGALKVLVSDLYNIRAEMLFDVASVISCTGPRVGPVDDPDRSKYFQGVVFYPPVVQADSPRATDYLGVARMARLVAAQFSTLDGLTLGASLFDFSDAAATRRTWGAVDDVVMGGRSASGAAADRGVLRFSGTVRTAGGGGFASTRTADFDQSLDLSQFDGLLLWVRGDGQTYKIVLRDERRWDGVAHCLSFETVKDEWKVVRAPFKDFRAVRRGRSLPSARSLRPSRLCSVQLMLSKFEYDGELNSSFQPGNFALLVARVRPYRARGASATGSPPRIVHLSAAAVTRPMRMAEVRGTPANVKILQLNDQIGRLLNFKLAGEDAVRASGASYCIMRSTALTVDDGVGVGRLVFDQGDMLYGKVARNDMAELMADALACPAAAGKTFEIATSEGDNAVETGEELGMRLEKLNADAMTERKFAPFPYVPDVVEGELEVSAELEV